MLELFRSEFERYKKWALLAASVCLFTYLFINKLKPFLEPSGAQTALTLMVFIAGSLIFGFVQMMLHKRKNHWTYLVHRPLEVKQIYLALCAAGTVVIAIVAIMPLIILIGGLDNFSAQVIEARHYAYIIFLFLTCCISYLVGTLTALNPSKGSILLITSLIIVLLPKQESLIALFLPQLIIIAGLLYLNLLSFKPDLSLHPQKLSGIFLMAAPMSAALVYALIMSTTVFYHFPLFVMGKHPDNNPVDGTFSYVWTYEENKRPAYALEQSEHPRAVHYSQQAELADLGRIDFYQWTYPSHDQLHTMDTSYAFEHKETGNVWQLSHAKMVIEGRNSISQKPVGFIGRNGFLSNDAIITDTDRFTEVPFLIGNRLIATKKSLFEVNFDEKTLLVKHNVSAGDSYISPPDFSEHYVSVLTEKQTLLFDKSDFSDEYEAATPEYVIPHPVAIENIDYVHTYRLIDGYLLLYFSRNYFGYNKSGMEVIHAKLGGGVESIGSRAFEIRKHPKVIENMEFLTSPIINAVLNQIMHMAEPSNIEHTSFSKTLGREYPSQVLVLIVILQAIAGCLSFLLSRRHRLGRPQTTLWTVMSLAFGLPTLVAFLLMNPWKREHTSA